MTDDAETPAQAAARLVEEMGNRGVAKLWAAQRARNAAPRVAKEPAAPKRAHPEQDRQDSIVLFVRKYARACRVAAVRNHTTPPLGLTDEQRIRYFMKLKQGGLWAGHPDLNLYLPNGRLCMWETKTPVGRLSAAQVLCHADLRALGHDVRVVLDVVQAQAVLRELGVLDHQTGRLGLAAPLAPLRGAR